MHKIFKNYQNKIAFKIITPIIPATEIIVSKAHHVRIVPFIVKPKNSLNNQNPESFGGLKITLPATTSKIIAIVFTKCAVKPRPTNLRKQLKSDHFILYIHMLSYNYE